MKLIDLHTHSTASDGIYSPRDLVSLALSNGVSVLSLTDHDTVDGVQEAGAAAHQAGMEFVPGIEFSVKSDRGTLHLVGLFIDHENASLREKTQELTSLRISRASRMVDDLKNHGVDIDFSEVRELAGDAAIGKPHIARILVKKGYSETVNDVFKKYLEKGMPGNVPKEKISFDDAVALIRGAGGLPVLAHPASLMIEESLEFESRLKDFVDRGLAGIEAFAYMHSDAQCAEYLRLARKYSLAVSGGSDFHGDKGETIGYAGQERPLGPELYREILEYRDSRG